jgi:type IV secretion system protein VirD4
MSELILGRSIAASRAMGFAARAHAEAGELLTYSGNGHLITFAPTGTGKTSGPVITNALKHHGQLIVLDMKGEVFAATARARSNMGQKVCVIDLRDTGETGSLNPIDLAMLGGTDPTAIGRSLAAELIERGVEERDRFWNDWSETMISGGVSWLIADQPPEQRRLSALFDLFTSDDASYSIAMMLDNNRVANRGAKSAFCSFLQLPDQSTRPSVLGSVQSHLRLFDSELTRKVTDTTTIDLEAFIAGEPMSLYFIVPPFRLMAYRPLLRLWLSGLILALTQRQRPPKERTLMLCDEIGNLGRMEPLLTAATLMRSWGLTLWSFWQNAAQLQIYGTQANTLTDNVGVIQIFGVRNYRMAQDLANVIGGISAEELLRLGKNDQVLLMESQLLRCSQVRHYEDKLFRTGG